MEKIKENISNLYDSTHHLIELHTKVVKLEIYERVTNLISSGINSAIVLIFALFAFTFLNLSAAYFLSEYLNSKVLGFLFVGLTYTALLLIYIVFQKKIAGNSVKNIILAKISKDLDNYDELLVMQKKAYQDIEESKLLIKANVEGLKSNFGFSSNGTNSLVPYGIKKILIGGLIRLGINKILLRNSNPITKTIFQVISDAGITAYIFKETLFGKFLQRAQDKLKELLIK